MNLQETKNLPALDDLIYSLTTFHTRTLRNDYTAAIEVVHIYFCASLSPCSSPTRTTRNFIEDEKQWNIIDQISRLKCWCSLRLTNLISRYLD
jgi:hypothetical protein